MTDEKSSEQDGPRSENAARINPAVQDRDLTSAALRAARTGNKVSRYPSVALAFENEKGQRNPKILLDGGFSIDYPKVLREKGFSVVHIAETNLASAPDADISREAVKAGAILVTHDKDFLNYDIRDLPGVVLVPQPKYKLDLGKNDKNFEFHQAMEHLTANASPDIAAWRATVIQYTWKGNIIVYGPASIAKSGHPKENVLRRGVYFNRAEP